MVNRWVNRMAFPGFPARVTRLASHHLLRLASMISFFTQTSVGARLCSESVEATLALRAPGGCSAAQQRHL